MSLKKFKNVYMSLSFRINLNIWEFILKNKYIIILGKFNIIIIL